MKSRGLAVFIPLILLLTFNGIFAQEGSAIVLFDIKTLQRGNELIITAEIEDHDKEISGCFYKLEVNKKGRSGSSQNVQSGEGSFKRKKTILSESRLGVQKNDSITCRLWIEPIAAKHKNGDKARKSKSLFKEKIIVIE